jgi:hypothetical protein
MQVVAGNDMVLVMYACDVCDATILIHALALKHRELITGVPARRIIGIARLPGTKVVQLRISREAHMPV